MSLSTDQLKKIVEVLETKLKVGTCPGCGEKDWSLVNDLTNLVLQPNPQGPLMLGGRSMPCIVLTCKVCGNTQFYNAILLGVSDIVGLTPPETVDVKGEADGK